MKSEESTNDFGDGIITRCRATPAKIVSNTVGMERLRSLVWQMGVDRSRRYSPVLESPVARTVDIKEPSQEMARLGTYLDRRSVKDHDKKFSGKEESRNSAQQASLAVKFNERRKRKVRTGKGMIGRKGIDEEAEKRRKGLLLGWR